MMRFPANGEGSQAKLWRAELQSARKWGVACKRYQACAVGRRVVDTDQPPGIMCGGSNDVRRGLGLLRAGER